MGEDLRTGAGRISTKKTKKKKEWKKVKHLSFVARLLYFAVSLGRTRKKRSLQIGSTFRPCRTFYQERKKNTWKNRCCCCLGVLKRILFDEVKRGGFAAVGKRKRIRERERERAELLLEIHFTEQFYGLRRKCVELRMSHWRETF